MLLDSKSEIRKKLLAQRASLSAGEVRARSQKIYNRFLSSFTALKIEPKSVGFYYPINGEVDTRPFFDFFKKQKRLCVFPKVTSIKNRTMDFFAVNDWSDLKTGAYGIAEPDPQAGTAGAKPVCPELLLVPGVAFSKDRHRLGYGAGYYDKFLSACRQSHTIFTIGIAYDFQVVNTLPVEATDQALDLLISESEF